MAHSINKDALVELRQKIQDALLKSAIAYYEAELACYEPAAPQSWKDDRNKAYDEFIWRCQDYQLINDSDDIDLEELNYDYI